MEMYKYENCQQFLEDFCYFKDYFPMVQEYLIKDNCYSDDDWIEWYSVYEGDVIVAFLAFRKTPLIPYYNHLSVFEVNIELRGCGIGTEILLNYLTENPNCTLYASDENRKFYEFLGFKKDPNERYLYKR